MRALEPASTGFALNPTDNARIYFEVFGPNDPAAPTLLLVPAYQIVHSRIWKMQVPFLARHFRTLVYDPRGNGYSDRPKTAYGIDILVGDALAVLDANGVATCGLVTFSAGSQTCIQLAVHHPERVTGMAIVGGYPGMDVTVGPALTPDVAAMRADYDAYVETFFASIFVEPHSTKPRDDAWDWAHQTTADTLIATREHGWLRTDARPIIDQVRCPVLVIHGTDDQRQPYERGVDLHARLPDAEMTTFEGSGHLPNLRDPVRINLLLRDHFGGAPPRPRIWSHALTRPRRALFVSSPIGLGHVQRDLAIARELRHLVPDLEIVWWAQHPVTSVLEAAGETIHPLSRSMASESAHWETAVEEHRLHAFNAFREMDEIFLANFMLFHDLTRAEQFDIWIGDEAWEIDYYLHENPELKSAPWVFLTDVIGFLPVDPDNPREVERCADYNAEMIEQRARYPRLRDCSLYVGEFDELPDVTFGPGLPNIRDWAREWFEPVGYITPALPADVHDRDALRARLGYPAGDPLIFAAVGGTSAGRFLLEQIAHAAPLLRDTVPNARIVVVSGPRIDPESIPEHAGLDMRRYVHNLYEHLACADAAIVQGGLSTTMELVAARRPFVYVPLGDHWEQQHFVAHRLNHYRAGIRLDAEMLTPETIAAALFEAQRRPTDYRPVPTDGARHAAERIAALLTAPRVDRTTPANAARLVSAIGD
jgi:pimeloyl-ACP methyl ester carboxylesterase/predicted glycosyltransferase